MNSPELRTAGDIPRMLMAIAMEFWQPVNIRWKE
jgi:hypothetical protein